MSSINCSLTEEKKKEFKNSKTFINYSRNIDDVYENLEDYNPTKKRIFLMVFDDMILNMESN